MAFTIDKIRRISQYAAADKPASENHGKIGRAHV